MFEAVVAVDESKLSADQAGVRATVSIHLSSRSDVAEFIRRCVAGQRIFLSTDGQFTAGTLLDLALIHPKTDCEIHLVAITARSVPAQDGRKAGVHVFFDEPTARLRADLQSFSERGEGRPPRPKPLQRPDN